MKNITRRTFSRSLVKALLQGLAVFAVFGMAVYVYAVTYPGTQPNEVSGVVGLYVGKTGSSYLGNLNGATGGYKTANGYCMNAVANSHVCSPMEMINTYNHSTSSPLLTETEPLWVNSGAPAYYSSISNDCLGWTTNSALYGQPVYGSVWQTSGKYGMITFCNQSLKFACCK